MFEAYLSKLPEPDEDRFTPGDQPNDFGVPAFHNPFDPASVATGKIIKTGTDVGDTWIIDLAVPCFENHCSQDWSDFVLSHNPTVLDPDIYQLSEELEGEVFGCDLWFEVTNIY